MGRRQVVFICRVAIAFPVTQVKSDPAVTSVNFHIVSRIVYLHPLTE
jgi:hypothetical protein